MNRLRLHLDARQRLHQRFDVNTHVHRDDRARIRVHRHDGGEGGLHEDGHVTAPTVYIDLRRLRDVQQALVVCLDVNRVIDNLHASENASQLLRLLHANLELAMSEGGGGLRREGRYSALRRY